MTCIAIDDEPFALKLIAGDIAKVPFLELKGTFASVMDALPALTRDPDQSAVDLLFLDIQMPTITGTQFLRTLKDPPMVIFTTVYEQYALEGFELNVVDYLMKPIPFDRFLKAANKAHELFNLKNNPSAEPKFFFVHSEYREIKIFYDDIQYVEGLKDYVKIFVAKEKHPILTRLNLKAIEGKLPSNEFVRIHNSFIVPLKKIKSFQKSQVFIGETAIPIGEKYAGNFKKQYGQ